MAGITSVSDSETSNKASPNAQAKPDDDAGSQGEEEEGGSEFEIEEVLDAKRGYFPEGRMGYYVKWKGYGEADNSWVDEVDAGNADALIAEFWRKNPNKRRAGAKPKPKSSPQKPRKSVTRDESSDIGSASVKKRGRKSAARIESEDGMDVDEVARPQKKAKKSTANAKKSKSDESDGGEERIVQNMDRYMDKSNWESLIKNVDTVERVGETLMVFFTLTTGEAVREDSEVCKKRFPQKLLQFYEDNLRWRQIDQDDEASP